ncbi:peptidoglycan-binding protein [Egibacter rhizosphaerae]|uniref:Peptidoglycan-binding protein n=2 Tax=Egibacter rhizosphaerae TaxID=1670831 RepID=A0A411YL79_9ACTN|nr:peptidoglycan-binding protein [Egibacter rhizosphaerae]
MAPDEPRPGDPVRGTPSYTHDVRGIQRALQHRGYDVGPIDGLFGPRTENALRAFQRDNGISVNGVVDHRTGSRLLGRSWEGGDEFRRGDTDFMDTGRPGDPVRGDQPPGRVSPEHDATPSGPGGGASVPGTTLDAPRDPDEPGPDASDEEIEEFVRERYGFMAWVLDEPELAEVMRTAIREGRDPDWIESQIMTTDWWTDTEPARREWQRIRSEDPARSEQVMDSVMLDIRLQASRMGVSIDQDRMRQLALEAVGNGWVDINTGRISQGERMQRAIANEADFRGDQRVGGDMGAMQDAIVAQSHEWMVPMSEDSALDWAQRILSGEATEDGLETHLRDMARSRYPHLEDYFARGVSPQQFFQPYREELARTLEMNPDTIDLVNDSRFSPVLDFATEGDERRPMTMSEVQQYARGLPEWRGTRQAQEQGSAFTEMLGRTFGRIA